MTKYTEVKYTDKEVRLSDAQESFKEKVEKEGKDEYEEKDMRSIWDG